METSGEQASSKKLESIALFLPGFAGGGAERVMITLAAEFITMGLSVDVVVPTTDGALRDEAFERLPPSSIVDLGTGKVRWSVAALARYLRRHSPDALLTAPDDTAFFAVLARRMAQRRSCALVATVHNTLSLQTAGLGPKRWLVGPALRWTMSRVDLIIAVSSGVAHDLVHNFRPGVDPEVILNTVDVNRIATLAQRDVKHPWLDSEHDVVVGIGRLVEQKDFRLLIRAFEAVTRVRPSARLILLGEGPLEHRLKELAKSLDLTNVVDFPGYVANPWAYLARSSVFALSSRFEGFALVVVEALASGVQVVSTDCPSGPAEILESGRIGRLVPVGDEQALADAIIEAIRNPLPPPPLSVLEKKYSPKSVAEQYVSVIQSAVRGQR